MQRDITAIPTEYAGCLFRSKTESKFAKWCDNEKIKWIYEPDGFVSNDGVCYLPDFFLPDFDTVVEVKPPMFLSEISKMKPLINSECCNKLHFNILTMGNSEPVVSIWFPPITVYNGYAEPAHYLTIPVTDRFNEHRVRDPGWFLLDGVVFSTYEEKEMIGGVTNIVNVELSDSAMYCTMYYLTSRFLSEKKDTLQNIEQIERAVMHGAISKECGSILIDHVNTMDGSHDF